MSPSASSPTSGAEGAVEDPPDVVPPCPTGLSITRRDFIRPDFSVDGFLTSWNSSTSVSGRPKTLETLRDDLGVYLKVLRSAMVELINEDYADFVNLSTNLVGLDQSMKQLEAPLVAYRGHVQEVRSTLDVTLESVHDKLRRREELHKKKVALQNLEHITNTIAKIERLLGLGSSDKSGHDLSGDLVERVATEINHLNFCVSKCESVSFVEELLPRLDAIGDCLHGSLEAQLLEAVAATEAKDETEGVLRRCLRIYATIDRVPNAERLVRERVVRPYLEAVVTEQSLSDDPKGLEGMFKRVQKIVPEKMAVLLQLTQKMERAGGGAGHQHHHRDYDFLVNSVWPEIVEQIDDNVSFIFSAGNPEFFFINYTTSMVFLAQFEKTLGSNAVAHFRDSEAHKNFLGRWNLPVYFQIRFQEIALPVELSVADIFAASPDASVFRLNAAEVAVKAVKKCFSSNIFLGALGHRFLKLTLQIISRFATGVSKASGLTVQQETAPEDKLKPVQAAGGGKGHARTASDLGVGGGGGAGTVSLTETYIDRPGELIKLWLDVRDLARYVEGEIVTDVILPAFASHSRDQVEAIRAAVSEGCDHLRLKQDPLTDLIVEKISSKCLPHLKQVSDIPRLYRRTNKELPNRPCSYMTALLGPIDAFYKEQTEKYRVDGTEPMQMWLVRIFSAVIEKYLLNVGEVLEAVQKMEESLKRLKRVRDTRLAGGGGASTLASTGADEGRGVISDDDKIRLQLYLDANYFLGRMSARYGVGAEEVEKAAALETIVSDATKSFTDIRVKMVAD